MKILFVYLFQALLQLIYLPLKAFCKVQDQVVYLSRQSNEKSLDMQLLEQAIEEKAPGTRQVFRLQMMEDGFAGKLRYFGHLVGDMKALASSKVVIVDTYSIAVSCLRHKAGVQVVQMWHALGAVKKFGLQSLGTKEGRDARLSHARPSLVPRHAHAPRLRLCVVPLGSHRSILYGSLWLPGREDQNLLPASGGRYCDSQRGAGAALLCREPGSQ